jgi:hypothetical protein
MTNAKEELIIALDNNVSQIKCARITYGWSFSHQDNFDLAVNHTELELKKYLDSLNFTYYSGHGGQELFGIVWLKDGTWLSRGEYDGSEWWIHNVLPEIPKKLL